MKQQQDHSSEPSSQQHLPNKTQDVGSTTPSNENISPNTYSQHRAYAADKHKYQIIDPDYKRPKVFELWEKFSLCHFVRMPSSTFTLHNSEEQSSESRPPCRGIYRRITDLMEDSYFLYHQYTKSKNND
ncbi:hypothetical protein C9374_005842 [Naegleria lovaniensis]|uniref:Uncharacterized protein n=1 Tax=Naegleria lovaniensis TaxID=51637 RepID=A0AA88GQ64_NAELO|nr:uncharacterized protein C9374_005842 [Naegleria lovaniensis]KAG2382050.1 hypothetical protein C9374_005842 [Naegleria lovaniensis]